MTDEKNELEGRAKASYLVASYGKWLGVHDAELHLDNDRSFGQVGFHYYPEKDALVGRVLVEKAWMPDDPEAVKNNFRKVGKALNDPKIGGMFDQGGGRFVLDEEKRMYFLTKSFPLKETTPRRLRVQMEKLKGVAGVWTMRWFAQVARITHGWEPPPETPVSAEISAAGGEEEGKE